MIVNRFYSTVKDKFCSHELMNMEGVSMETRHLYTTDEHYNELNAKVLYISDMRDVATVCNRFPGLMVRCDGRDYICVPTFCSMLRNEEIKLKAIMDSAEQTNDTCIHDAYIAVCHFVDFVNANVSQIVKL